MDSAPELNLAYTVLGATVLLLSLAAAPVKRRLWLSEPLVATSAGVLLGPSGLGAFHPAQWGGGAFTLSEVARLTLAISLLGVAMRLPNRWVQRHASSLLVLLLVAMPVTWLVSSFSAWALLDLPLLQALLLGAILTPTDPVVASSIVTGKLAERSVRDDVRHLLSAESGANDGLAFLLVMLPVLLAERSVPDALSHWFLVVFLAEVLGSILLGALTGWASGKLLEWLYRRRNSHRGSLLSVSVALALLLLGITALAGGDGILAVFAAGIAFNWVIREEEGHDEARHERIQETITRFFDVPVFVLFGMLIPWQAWQGLGLPAMAFVVALLVLRRLPVVVLLHRKIAPLEGLKDALFIGWFGPMAVAAMVYASWARLHEADERLWHLASLAIFASILVHGITSTPLTRWYGKGRSAD